MEHLHDVFALEVAEFQEWKERSRKNNFFEIVYVLDGSGSQSVNYVQYPYRKNDTFLLPTAKCHQYIIKEPTKFLFVRFTASYFVPAVNDRVDYSQWFSRLNFIIGNHHHHPGELIDDPHDRTQVKRLLDVILMEYESRDICSAFIIQNTLVSILGVICRNIQRKVLKGRRFTDSKFADLLNFISFNILDADKLSVPYLSEKFHIAESYFSEYFRRNASESFQDYVIKSKLRIAESRARYTELPLKQIALELGFTDSSHLNKLMKKHFGKGMREIRSGKNE
ncbi:AraC family transcriptional regulator [Pedobacter sp. AW31-3R]|uniref:AraC family transcriptional regulator n=1 Tax=Pedobacter sp. AW31-3R TaxID=3445781 RepID=UPI003F9FB1F1